MEGERRAMVADDRPGTAWQAAEVSGEQYFINLG